MAQWIEVDDGRRWEFVPPGRALNLLQVARACKEVGLDPERLGSALRDPDAGADRFLAMAVVIYAARWAAGERFATVAEANEGIPSASWEIVDDEPEVDEDPTGRPDGGDASSP